MGTPATTLSLNAKRGKKARTHPTDHVGSGPHICTGTGAHACISIGSFAARRCGWSGREWTQAFGCRCRIRWLARACPTNCPNKCPTKRRINCPTNWLCELRPHVLPLCLQVMFHVTLTNNLPSASSSTYADYVMLCSYVAHFQPTVVACHLHQTALQTPPCRQELRLMTPLQSPPCSQLNYL
jgi:hypothetical protein